MMASNNKLSAPNVRLIAIAVTALLAAAGPTLAMASGAKGRRSAASTNAEITLDFALSIFTGASAVKLLTQMKEQGRTTITENELKIMRGMANIADEAIPGPSSTTEQQQLPPGARKRGTVSIVDGKVVKEPGEGLCKVHGPDPNWMDNGHYDSLQYSMEYARMALMAWLRQQELPLPPAASEKRRLEAQNQVDNVSMQKTALDHKDNHALMGQYRPFYLHHMLTCPKESEGRMFLAQLVFGTCFDAWKSWDPEKSPNPPPEVEHVLKQVQRQSPVLVPTGKPLLDRINDYFRRRMAAGSKPLSNSAIKKKYTGARKIMWASGMEFDPEAKLLGPGGKPVLTNAHVVRLMDSSVLSISPLNPFSSDIKEYMKDVQLKMYRLQAADGDSDDDDMDIDARDGSAYHSQAYTNAKMFEERARCQKALNEAIRASNDINQPPDKVPKGGFKVATAAMVLWASVMRLVRGCRPSDPIHDNFYNTATFLVHLPALLKTIEVPVAFCATREGAAFLQDYFMSGDAPYILRCAHTKMYSEPKANEGVPGPQVNVKYDAHIAYAWPVSMFNVPILMSTVMSIIFRYYGTSFELFKAGIGKFDRGLARLGIMRGGAAGASANLSDEFVNRIGKRSSDMGIFPEPDPDHIKPGTPEKHTPESSRYFHASANLTRQLPQDWVVFRAGHSLNSVIDMRYARCNPKFVRVRGDKWTKDNYGYTPITRDQAMQINYYLTKLPIVYFDDPAANTQLENHFKDNAPLKACISKHWPTKADQQRLADGIAKFKIAVTEPTQEAYAWLYRQINGSDAVPGNGKFAKLSYPKFSFRGLNIAAPEYSATRGIMGRLPFPAKNMEAWEPQLPPAWRTYTMNCMDLFFYMVPRNLST